MARRRGSGAAQESPGGFKARAAPPLRCLPAGQESFPKRRSQPQLRVLSYRVFGASEEDRRARTTEIRPLFPPGTAAPPLRAGGPQQPPPTTPPEELAGLRARGRLGSAQAQAEPAREGRRGRRARSAVLRPADALLWKLSAVARPLPPSRPLALAGRGLANPTLGA